MTPPLAHPTLIITGCNGLLGQQLLLSLPKNLPYQVIALSKSPLQVALPPTVTFIQLDLSQPQAVEAKLCPLQPAVILHTAALTQPDVCEQQPTLAYLHNVVVVENLVRVAEQCGTFIVHLSTDFVFDGTSALLTETAVPRPINYYGQTKWEAEQCLQQSRVAWAIVRTCLVFGIPTQAARSNILLWVLRNLGNEQAIRVVNDQFRTPTFVKDLAVACWLVVQQKALGIWHIAGQEYLTPYEFACIIAEVFGLNAAYISPTNALEFKEIAQRPLQTGFDSAKAKKILGYIPTPLVVALQELITHKKLHFS